MITVTGLMSLMACAGSLPEVPQCLSYSALPVEHLRLKLGETQSVRVFAKQAENHSGVMMKEGDKYRVSVPKDQTWWDSRYKNSPPCGTPPFIMRLFPSLFKREPKAEWFSLMAHVQGDSKPQDMCTTKSDGSQFFADGCGELLFFANDAGWFYENNSGCIEVIVQRVE